MNRSAPFPGSNLKARTSAETTAAFMRQVTEERIQRIANFETFIAGAEGNPHMARHVERAKKEIEALRRAGA